MSAASGAASGGTSGSGSSGGTGATSGAVASGSSGSASTGALTTEDGGVYAGEPSLAARVSPTAMGIRPTVKRWPTRGIGADTRAHIAQWPRATRFAAALVATTTWESVT
jgi:hypothetical protein